MKDGLQRSWPELEAEMLRYQKNSTLEEPLLEFYRDLFHAWCRLRDEIKMSLPWDEEDLRQLLREGRYLLAHKPPDIDKEQFRKVLQEIVEMVIKHFPGAEGLKQLIALTGGEKLHEIFDRITGFDREQLAGFLIEHGWEEKEGPEVSLPAYVFFAALTPFYLSLAGEVSKRVDFILWKEGYCPICGQKPSMARLRKEDGARFLECGLCHTQWQFSRMECPFCRNKDFEKQQFFYTEEHSGRRVQLCERCKSYLKTVAEKELEGEIILELDNIFTTELDYLARREGYRPGDDLAVLI